MLVGASDRPRDLGDRDVRRPQARRAARAPCPGHRPGDGHHPRRAIVGSALAVAPKSGARWRSVPIAGALRAILAEHSLALEWNEGLASAARTTTRSSP